MQGIMTVPLVSGMYVNIVASELDRGYVCPLTYVYMSELLNGQSGMVRFEHGIKHALTPNFYPTGKLL